MEALAAWLGAQLDEDDRIARSASWHEDAGTWTAQASEYASKYRSGPRWFILDSMDDGVITDVDPQASENEGVARHVAEHDPARVLREIEAKRQIVALHTEGTSELFCAHCEHEPPCPTLRLLALPYADRPGYRDEWAPTP